MRTRPVHHHRVTRRQPRQNLTRDPVGLTVGAPHQRKLPARLTACEILWYRCGMCLTTRLHITRNHPLRKPHWRTGRQMPGQVADQAVFTRA